jgi:hypothetical protein
VRVLTAPALDGSGWVTGSDDGSAAVVPCRVCPLTEETP